MTQRSGRCFLIFFAVLFREYSTGVGKKVSRPQIIGVQACFGCCELSSQSIIRESSTLYERGFSSYDTAVRYPVGETAIRRNEVCSNTGYSSNRIPSSVFVNTPANIRNALCLPRVQ